MLIDFGAARLHTQSASKPLSAILTEGYAPYEQYLQQKEGKTTQEQGPWTDIYALAAVLYRCLAGLTPPSALMRKHEVSDGDGQDPLEPILSIADGVADTPNGVSDEMVSAIAWGLQINRKDRPQSIAEWRPKFDIRRKVFEETIYVGEDISKSLQDGDSEYTDPTTKDYTNGTEGFDTEGGTNVPPVAIKKKKHSGLKFALAAVSVVVVAAAWSYLFLHTRNAKPPIERDSPATREVIEALAHNDFDKAFYTLKVASSKIQNDIILNLIAEKLETTPNTFETIKLLRTWSENPYTSKNAFRDAITSRADRLGMYFKHVGEARHLIGQKRYREAELELDYAEHQNIEPNEISGLRKDIKSGQISEDLAKAERAGEDKHFGDAAALTTPLIALKDEMLDDHKIRIANLQSKIVAHIDSLFEAAAQNLKAQKIESVMDAIQHIDSTFNTSLSAAHRKALTGLLAGIASHIDVLISAAEQDLRNRNVEQSIGTALLLKSNLDASLSPTQRSNLDSLVDRITKHLASLLNQIEPLNGRRSRLDTVGALLPKLHAFGPDSSFETLQRELNAQLNTAILKIQNQTPYELEGEIGATPLKRIPAGEETLTSIDVSILGANTRHPISLGAPTRPDRDITNAIVLLTGGSGNTFVVTELPEKFQAVSIDLPEAVLVYIHRPGSTNYELLKRSSNTFALSLPGGTYQLLYKKPDHKDQEHSFKVAFQDGVQRILPPTTYDPAPWLADLNNLEKQINTISIPELRKGYDRITTFTFEDPQNIKRRDAIGRALISKEDEERERIAAELKKAALERQHRVEQALAGVASAYRDGADSFAKGANAYKAARANKTSPDLADVLKAKAKFAKTRTDCAGILADFPEARQATEVARRCKLYEVAVDFISEKDYASKRPYAKVLLTQSETSDNKGLKEFMANRTLAYEALMAENAINLLLIDLGKIHNP